jgi:hypothetical protein
MNIEYIGAQEIDGYTFRCIRTDAEAKIFQPKNFQEAWPGSSEISLPEAKFVFIGPASNNNIRRLLAPGVKRYFYIHNVPFPWKVEKNLDILFAYQLESTGGIHFLLESSPEIAEVMRRGQAKSTHSGRKMGILLTVLFFPISLLFWNTLLKKHHSTIKPLPDFTAFQTFISKTYKS